MRSPAFRLACASLLVALGACQTSKSSTPTAPTVAGPIPGVNITAPGLLEPAQGVKFKENEQPIRLLVANATSSGVRALSYTFEVASDAGFSTKVFSRAGVAPGADNKTSVQVDRLDIGRAYYWRAWAQDGANTGAMATANFEIYPKASVNAPVAVSPVNNAVAGSVAPLIIVSNASVVGPVSNLSYEFQVASDQAFTRVVASARMSEQAGGRTQYQAPGLAAGASLFWRARAGDAETSSTWSVTQTFRTPAAPAPSPTPPPSGGGGNGGSCASRDGTAIVNCIAAKYPERLVAGVSLSTRQANMAFLRDRVIEAARCAGLDVGWNLKRGGPELSIDFVAERVNGQVLGHDIAFDYDNTSTPLRLYWGGGDFPSYGGYTNSFSCGG